MFNSRHSWLIVGLIAASSFLFPSCQSTVSTDEPTTGQLQYDLTARNGGIPDSATWSFAGQSGTGTAVAKPGAVATATITFSLPKPPGTQTVTANYWTLSVHTATETIAGSTRAIIWRDELALALLSRLDSLRKTADSTQYSWSTASLIQLYAKALVDRDTSFKGFPSKRVTTLDTNTIYKVALVYAASKHIPFSIQSKSWLLGLDSATAYKLVSKLMAPAGPISAADSLSLFPPFPVRVATPIAIGTLHIEGPTVMVSGSFVGDSGLSAYKVRVLQGSLDVSDQFNIASQPTQLNGSQTTWNLAADARLTLQVKSAAVGSYTLEVSVSDKKSRADTSRVKFVVEPPPDHTGPTISWLAPTSSLLLNYNDSILAIKIKVFDASKVDSIWIKGKRIPKSDSTWNVSIVVPFGDAGIDINVSAWDEFGNRTDSIKHVIRMAPVVPNAPNIRLMSPLANTRNVLPFDSVSIRVSWSITHPSGIDSSSVVVKGASSLSHKDSVWTATVPVPPTGMETTILVQAKSVVGGQSSDYVQVTRQRDTVAPVIVPPSWDTGYVVDFDSTQLWVEYQISDNHKLATVTINDSVIKGDGMIFGALISLAVGLNSINVKATDSTGNSKQLRHQITRKKDTLAPKILRIDGATSKKVLWKDSLFQSRWVVTDDGAKLTVKINGVAVKGSSYEFSRSIPLVVGDNSIKVEAIDRANNKSVDSIVVTRAAPLAISMSCGYNHTVALLEDGRIMAWGDSSKGQYSVPPQDSRYVKVVSNGNVSAVLRNDGKIFLWGDTTNGTSSISNSTEVYTDVALVWNNFVVGLTKNGRIQAYGINDPEDGITQFYISYETMNEKVVKISGGYRHALALTESGKVYGWGFGENGQTNPPKTLPKIKEIAAGTLQSVAIDTAGKTYTWGNDGQPGIEVPANLGPAKKLAANTASAAVLENGGVAIWATTAQILEPPSDIQNVSEISLGASHACVLRNNGTVFCWGNGANTRLNVPFDLRQ